MTVNTGSRHFIVWITLIVALLQMLGPFSIDAYMPSFPEISGDLLASPLQMQQTMSVYMAGFAVMNLFYGSISDAYGRRSVVLAALFGYVLCSVACALSRDIHVLLWLRAGQGIFAAAGVVVGRAMIRDLYDGHRAQQVMSHAMTWFALAPALAPVIGGWLHSLWGWRAVFWFLALFAGLLALLLATRMKESLAQEHRQTLHPVYLLRMYLRAVSNRRFLSISVSMAVFFAGFFLYITSAPTVVYEHLHLGANDFIYLFGPLVAGMMIGAQLSGRLAASWSQQSIILLGISLMLVSASFNMVQSMYLLPGVLNTVGPVAIYVMGVAVVMPVLSIMAIDCFPQNRGLASSLQGFIQVGTNAIVAGVVVPLLYHSLAHLAMGMVGFFVAGYIVYRFGVHQTVA